MQIAGLVVDLSNFPLANGISAVSINLQSNGPNQSPHNPRMLMR